MTRKNILVAALDWGLGHATRLIPVITQLKAAGCNVVLASSGSALSYWKTEFPDEEIITLPAYNPIYSGNMNFSIAIQTPKFLKTIYAEHTLLKKMVTRYDIHGIISDNRYGLFHSRVPSVIVTHQLFIQTPKQLSFLKPVLKKINFQFINRFNYCWIPDFEEQENISGSLSHAKKIPNHCRYIGLLSRFRKEDTAIKNDILVLLSGPEPQRTYLEQTLLHELQTVNKKIIFVRGTNEPLNSQTVISNNIHIIPLLTSQELNKQVNESALIIARSGYSTIMDLIKTQKPAILIPTLGQTEQEYLAEYLEQKKWFVSAKQNNLDLKSLLSLTANKKPASIHSDNEYLLKKAITEFLAM